MSKGLFHCNCGHSFEANMEPPLGWSICPKCKQGWGYTFNGEIMKRYFSSDVVQKVDHAYQLGRKFRTGNITHNPYKWIERRGESCASLLLYFQKGWSDQDTDLTLSVS